MASATFTSYYQFVERQKVVHSKRACNKLLRVTRCSNHLQAELVWPLLGWKICVKCNLYKI